MRIAFVTNICAHYRTKTFEVLARHHDVDYYFFSAGDDWYWQQQHGVQAGAFSHRYLPGFRLGGTRIAPSLPWALWRRQYDAYIKCINGRFALPVTYLVAQIRHRPFILWTGVWMRLRTPAHRLLFPLTRFIYRHADAIVVYGDHVKRYLLTEGVEAERIFVAPHAVDNGPYQRPVSDDEKTDLRTELRVPEKQRIVLYLGRLEPGKGLDYLLDAFAALPAHDAVLVLAGAGSLGPHLQQLVEERGIVDRVRFAGYVPWQKTVLYYSLAHVHVLPSVTTRAFKEPWGLVVNEAMNQGVPAVVSDAVGAAAGSLVQDGFNGFIVPERDSAALAHAMDKLLRDDGLRQRLGENARNTVADWDNARMVKGFLRAINYAMQHSG